MTAHIAGPILSGRAENRSTESVHSALGAVDAPCLPLADVTVELAVASPPYGLDVAYPHGDAPADDLARGHDPGGYCAEHGRRLSYPEQQRGACSWCVPVDPEREPEYWASHWRRFTERP